MLARLLNLFGRTLGLNTAAGTSALPRSRRPGAGGSSRRTQRPSLCVEELGPRIVPATRIWDGGAGPNDFNCSSAANWVDNIAPLGGDTLIFNASSSKNALVDPNFPLVFDDIVITSDYTGTIGLEYDLVVTGILTQEGGTIAGNGTLTIDNGARYDWVSGPWLGLGTTRIAAGGEMVVSGGAKYITGWRLENAGAVRWGDTGNLYAVAATVSNTGTFDVSASTSLHDSYLGLSSFINDGRAYASPFL